MKRMLTVLAVSASVFAVAPANAAALLPGAGTSPTPGSPFTPFSTVAGTQGTQLAGLTFVADADTYDAILRTAVYANTLGTLDFYYQVAVTQIDVGDEIERLTASVFAGYQVTAFFAGGASADLDGAGNSDVNFTAANNPNSDGPGGTSLGFTTLAGRSGGPGTVVRAQFGQNGLETAGEISAVYIFRTNAASFNENGTFSTIDGSTVTIDAFQPIGPGVPEPSTWAMMLAGFGMIGSFMRRRPKGLRVSFA